MKISFEKNNKKLCDVNVGEVFKFKDQFYIRIEDIVDYDTCNHFRAVDLSNGKLYCLSDNNPVQLCDAELQIKG